MDAPKKKPPERAAVIAWLVVCWLLVDYPFGLWLFVLSAALYGTLQRFQKISGRDIDARRIGEIA
jgi:hypothetical protein